MRDQGSSAVPPEGVMQELKAATIDAHKELETLPYFTALMKHTLPLENYLCQLRALAVIHGVFEEEISSVEDNAVQPQWQDSMRKLPLLEDDLRFFSPRLKPSDTGSVEAALEMAHAIRRRRQEGPESLLGYLYVFEGSTLGNLMHTPDIVKTFRLDGRNGCKYYLSYGEQVAENWQRFSRQMNEQVTNQQLQSAVVEAAVEAFAGLQTVYERLYPLAVDNQTFQAVQINPEAGNHPMPGDEREIRAALAASERCWREYPYYEQRYGERGKRFSDSDMCWLVTLARLDEISLQMQIDWLCRLLAARGMPSIMLERGLEILYEELAAGLPENETAYAALRQAAERLRERRTAQLPQPLFERLVADFAEALGSERSSEEGKSAELLLSAVIDDYNSIEGGDNVREWHQDPARCSADWVSAVEKLIAEAHELCGADNKRGQG